MNRKRIISIGIELSLTNFNTSSFNVAEKIRQHFLSSKLRNVKYGFIDNSINLFLQNKKLNIDDFKSIYGFSNKYIVIYNSFTTYVESNLLIDGIVYSALYYFFSMYSSKNFDELEKFILLLTLVNIFAYYSIYMNLNYITAINDVLSIPYINIDSKILRFLEKVVPERFDFPFICRANNIFEYLSEGNETISVKQAVEINKCSRVTAYRDLNRLVMNFRLIKSGQYKSSKYLLNDKNIV